MQTQIIAFLSDANKLLCSFLKKTLPFLANNWWNICVVKNLSFHQRRRIEFKKSSSLSDLDLAALLRIFDKNWYKINKIKKFPHEALNYVKEMQAVRNKWAHIGTGDVPKDDIFRDLDTLQRFIRLIKPDDKLIKKIQYIKKIFLITIK